jgi:hypothetical protein
VNLRRRRRHFATSTAALSKSLRAGERDEAGRGKDHSKPVCGIAKHVRSLPSEMVRLSIDNDNSERNAQRKRFGANSFKYCCLV